MGLNYFIAAFILLLVQSSSGIDEVTRKFELLMPKVKPYRVKKVIHMESEYNLLISNFSMKTSFKH